MNLYFDSADNEVDPAVQFGHVPREMIGSIQRRFPSAELWDPQQAAVAARSEKARERILRDFPDPNLVRLYLPITDATSIAPILELRPMLVEAGVTFAVVIWIGMKNWSLLRKLPSHVAEHITALDAQIVLKVVVLRETQES